MPSIVLVHVSGLNCSGWKLSLGQPYEVGCCLEGCKIYTNIVMVPISKHMLEESYLLCVNKLVDLLIN